MPGFTVTASLDDCWSTLLDLTSWAQWWVLGAPQVAGDLRQGAELVWQGAPGVPARALVERFEPPNFLHLTFTAGDDGLPHKRGTTVRWDLDLFPSAGATEVQVTRRAAMPAVMTPRSRGVIAATEKAIVEGLKAALEETTSSRGHVPDVEALAAAGDRDGLIAALAHPEPVARGAAVAALAQLSGDARVVEAILGAGRDPDWTVRQAVVLGLVKLGDERGTPTLIALAEDDSPAVKQLAMKEAGAMRAAFYAARSRGYADEDREHLRGAPGPRFERTPTESFLGLPLAMYLSDREVFETTSTTAKGGPSAVTVKVAFPPVCSACLEPTDRSEIDVVRRFEWTRVLTTTETRMTVTAHLPIPICERCVGYCLDRLILTGSSHRIGWEVTFRFPNIAYYPVFGRGQLLRVDHTGEPRLREEEKRPYELGLQTWAHVRDTIGFHRYAQLKHRLLELGASATKGQLAALADEHEVTLDQLRTVEQIANEQIPALRSLNG